MSFMKYVSIYGDYSQKQDLSFSNGLASLILKFFPKGRERWRLVFLICQSVVYLWQPDVGGGRFQNPLILSFFSPRAEWHSNWQMMRQKSKLVSPNFNSIWISDSTMNERCYALWGSESFLPTAMDVSSSSSSCVFSTKASDTSLRQKEMKKSTRTLAEREAKSDVDQVARIKTEGCSAARSYDTIN